MKERFKAVKTRLSAIGTGRVASAALIATAIVVFWLKGPSAGTYPMWEKTRDKLRGKDGESSPESEKTEK